MCSQGNDRGEAMKGKPEQRRIYKLKPIIQARAADARGGDNHTRTAAAPAAAAKLVRRTFLGDHTEGNSFQQMDEGNTWSIKIHDFGKQWVESSWGKVDVRAGKRGAKVDHTIGIRTNNEPALVRKVRSGENA